MTPFGQKLNELRQQHGITQAKMARDFDVSAAYLSALEHGKKGAPPTAIIQKVIDYFGLIWDDAEEITDLARYSRPKVQFDMQGLTPLAVGFINRLHRQIGQLDDRALDELMSELERTRQASRRRKKQSEDE